MLKLLRTFFTSHLTIIILICLSFANNLMFMAAIRRDLYSDSVIYMSMARRFLEGQPEYLLHPMWQPLYPLTSAFFFLIFKDWLVAARMVSVVFGSLLVIPVYLLTKNLLGKYPAVLASLLVIFLKPLTVSSIAPLSEALVIFFFWSGLYLLWKGVQKANYFFSFLAGISWGLTYLTRTEGAFALAGFTIMTFFYLAWRTLSRHSTKMFPQGWLQSKQLMVIFLLVLSGFLLIYSPFFIGMRIKYKKSFSLAKAAALFNVDGGAVKFNHDKTSTWAQDIWSIRTFNPNSEFFIYTGYQNPERRKYLFLDTWTRICIFFQRYFQGYFGILGIILALIGCLKLLRSQKTFSLIFIPVLMIMFVSLSFFAPSAQERYIFWILPFFIISIIAGITFLASTLKRINSISLTVIFLFFVFTQRDNYLFLYISSPGKIAAPNDSVAALSAVDSWLSKKYPGATVMAGHERVVFSNRGLLVYQPNAQDPEEFLSYARLKKVDFIVATRGEAPPVMEYLYKTPKNYPGLTLVYSRPDLSIYIYKLIY